MSASWPYEEARKLVAETLAGRIQPDQIVTFETGYGPSGLPHIGTFTEVLRTEWVRRAYEEMTGAKTRLIVFSDDLDALRKVPDNVPNGEMLKAHLGYSLSSIPDPFGCCESFATHNNRKLQQFLEDFNFDYEFVSATEAYCGGHFRGALRHMLEHYDTIRDIILPTLGEERRATYSPFMPIVNGRVLHEGYLSHDPVTGVITFMEEGQPSSFPVGGGNVKLQWKADWAMRWLALGVNYEMAGKDLIDSVNLSSQICRAVGFNPPVGFNYEMFLDENGEKISKSKGNGLSIEEWLTYGPQQSLAYYLYREPRKAKKLYVGLIPRAIDEYYQARARYAAQDEKERQGNPVHHVHGGEVPAETMPVTFGLLLNLIGILGEPTEEQVWAYVQNNYASEASDELRSLIPYALRYHRDHLAKEITRREPHWLEAIALRRLADELETLPEDASAEDIQFIVYEVGKAVDMGDNLRAWFKIIYETVFGASEGPRLGVFIKVYGIAPFVELLRRVSEPVPAQ
jgi:lysyl-tRNA synthetase class 1